MTPIDIGQIVGSLGFPIVVVIMIIRGDLVPGFIYKKTVIDNDRLNSLVTEQVIPLLDSTRRVVEMNGQTMKSALDLIDDKEWEAYKDGRRPDRPTRHSEDGA